MYGLARSFTRCFLGSGVLPPDAHCTPSLQYVYRGINIQISRANQTYFSYGLGIGLLRRIGISGIGRGRQILGNGCPFSREIENGLCATCCSAFRLHQSRPSRRCPAYLWLLILVAAKQASDQITRRLVAYGPSRASCPNDSESTQDFGGGGY